jgi:hypothetical protein
MKYYACDKSLTKHLQLHFAQSGNWREFGLGFTLNWELSRGTVSDDLAEQGRFFLVNIALLWWRFSLSYLFNRQPLSLKWS